MTAITAAAVRLFAAAYEIENEVEDKITEAMSNEELLAYCRLDLDEQQRGIKAVLDNHPEYQHVKAELAQQLQLRPTDINPLDVMHHLRDNDDTVVEGLVAGIETYQALSEAFMDWLMWWRPKASSGNVVHLRAKPEASA